MRTSVGDANRILLVYSQYKGSITQEAASAVTPYGTEPYDGAGYATFGMNPFLYTCFLGIASPDDHFPRL
jgi:hypothetical protein